MRHTHRARSSFWAALSAPVLVLLLAACGPVTSAPPPHHQAKLASVSDSDLPGCRTGWLRVSVPHPKVRKLTPGDKGSEQVLVSTEKSCQLKGWPGFGQVPPTKKLTGNRPHFRELRRGQPKAIALAPSRPAVSRVTVVLPKRWVWPGGNICGGYISAEVRIAQLTSKQFVFDASPILPICGMPPRTVVHVTAWPFRSQPKESADR